VAIALRQSTASQEVPLGHFLDSTDGDSAETGLTIANTDIQVWKTGATSLANKHSGGATHIAGGVYYAVLDATDTDTIGPLALFVHVAGALAVKVECVVYAAAVFDAMFGTTAPALVGSAMTLAADQAVNVTKVNGTAQTAGDLAAQLALVRTKSDNLPADTNTLLTSTGIKVQTNADKTGYSLSSAPPSAATIAAAVCDEALSGHTTSGTLGAVITFVRKLLQNRTETNPETGVETRYDDDSETVLVSGDIYQDVAGTTPFDGTGANRRDRLA
jgi:hypothetical protein